MEEIVRSLVSWTDAVVDPYIFYKAWWFTSVLIPNQSVFDQVLEKMIQLLYCNTWHNHHMSYIALTSKLPPSDKLFLLGTFKDHSAAKLIEHRADPSVTESVFEVMRISQAFLNLFLESFVTFPV